jgi:hypothetical protein
MPREMPKAASKADRYRCPRVCGGLPRYYIILSHDVGYYTKETANDMWTKIEDAAITLHSYIEAIKANKGITDEL